MTKEELEEFEELNKYKDLVCLMWDFIDEIVYDKNTYVLTVKFNQLVLDTREIKVFVEPDKAERMYQVFCLLETENGINQEES